MGLRGGFLSGLESIVYIGRKAGVYCHAPCGRQADLLRSTLVKRGTGWWGELVLLDETSILRGRVVFPLLVDGELALDEFLASTLGGEWVSQRPPRQHLPENHPRAA